MRERASTNKRSTGLRESFSFGEVVQKLTFGSDCELLKQASYFVNITVDHSYRVRNLELMSHDLGCAAVSSLCESHALHGVK